MAEMVEAALLAVALAGGIDERQVARRADCRSRPRAVEEARLERDGDVLGEADADEAAGRDRVAVADQPHRVGAETTLPRAGVRRDCSRGWMTRSIRE